MFLESLLFPFSSLACLSFAADGPLPEYILGEYKYESSENYDEFLTDLGNYRVPD